MPSTVIRSFEYDGDSQILAVTFLSGRRYRYFGVPRKTYEAMRLSASKGGFFNRQVRDHFPFTEEQGGRDA